MSMTVIVTRDVAPRFGGFLASCALEIAPGVFIAPAMTKSVRERVWGVLEGWFMTLGGGSIVMTWREPKAAGGQGIRVLGLPPREIQEMDGVLLLRRGI
jgi:CRISPR-associated protein Cas2